MFNSKYSKTLTVILIVVIIAIIGLLIFFGVDVYRRYYIESTAGDAVEEFKDEVNKIASLPVDENTILNDVSPNVDLNTLYQNNGSSIDDDEITGVDYMGYSMIGTIEIPKTDIEYPIIADEDASINSLNVAIVKLYPSSDLLNEVGNTVLAGHNYKNGTFFSNNKKLEKGDEIYITDLTGRKVTYEIYNIYETTTSDSEYMNRDTNGRREISLSTCTDDTKERLIIWAAEKMASF